MALTTHGDHIISACSLEADYALVAIKPQGYVLSDGLFITRLRGEPVIAYHVAVAGYSLIYASTAFLTSSTPRASLVAGVSILADQPLTVYGDDAPQVDLNLAFGYERPHITNDDVRDVLRCIDGGSCMELPVEWEDSKVTGEHHTLVRPIEALRAAPRDRWLQMAVAYARAKRFSGPQAFVSGLLLWSATADARLVDTVLMSSRLWAVPEIESWVHAAKRASADLKTHQHYTDLPLEQLFELQVIANRGIGEVDWEAERAHRTDPHTVQIDPSFVRAAARDIFMTAHGEGYRYARETFDQFWARRWASTPTGSVHSQYAGDGAFISHENRFERNKQATVIKMPDYPLSHWTSRQPEIVAWPSHKYEWAKNRAIYGTDLTSYVLTDFAMPAVEEALSSVFPVGRKANENYVRERVRLAGEGGVAVCFDYEDFNSQHSLEAMLAVLQGYCDAFSFMMSPDQYEAMTWVLESVVRQRVETDQPYTTAGTLLSGWRLTTVVNTVLNRVYLQHAGALKMARDAVHNGDDVLAFTTTVRDAVEMLSRAQAAGIRAQPAKCAIAGLQEFLRVDRAAARPTAAQYLTRAVATAVHARAESREPDDAMAAMRAQRTRLSELAARGASPIVVERLKNSSDAVVVRAFAAQPDLPDIADRTHLVHGGFCEDPDVPPEYVISSDRTYTELEWEEEVEYPGVRAYARYLAGVFKLGPRLQERALQAIAKATKAAKTAVRTAPVVCKQTNVFVARVQQELHRICKDDYAVAAYTGRARLARVPIGRLAIGSLSGAAMARVQCSADPFRTMTVIF